MATKYLTWGEIKAKYSGMPEVTINDSVESNIYPNLLEIKNNTNLNVGTLGPSQQYQLVTENLISIPKRKVIIRLPRINVYRYRSVGGSFDGPDISSISYESMTINLSLLIKVGVKVNGTWNDITERYAGESLVGSDWKLDLVATHSSSEVDWDLTASYSNNSIDIPSNAFIALGVSNFKWNQQVNSTPNKPSNYQDSLTMSPSGKMYDGYWESTLGISKYLDITYDSISGQPHVLVEGSPTLDDYSTWDLFRTTFESMKLALSILT